MRIKDAIASLQLTRKKHTDITQLSTPWSEPGPDGKPIDGPDYVPLPEYPRPRLRRNDWINLNGWWDYRILRPGSGKKPSGGRILVPFSPETARSGVGITLLSGETFAYRRKIKLPLIPEGKRLILHFGAVDERCAVYWNGKPAGKHKNGYLPFSFDITGLAREGENELQVRVRDDTDTGPACRGKQTLKPGGMYYHAQSGIWQTVWLETVPDIYLENITPVPDIGKRRVDLRLVLSGLPGKASPRQIKNRLPDITVTSEGRTHYFPGNRLKATPGDTPGTVEFTLTIPVFDLTLWSPESPSLYPVTIEAGNDRAESYFAMREFGTGRDEKGFPCLTLNKKPFFFHGVLDQGYWPESLMTPPSDEAMVFDIRGAKKLGFNTIRKHVKIEPERWYYHCDRLGMVVWQDMVNGGGRPFKLLVTYLPNILPGIVRRVDDRHLHFLLSRSKKAPRKEFEQDLITMIRRLGGSPCIGMWVPFNEGWGQFDSLRITELIRKTDPSRPVDHAGGWFDRGGGDIHSVHNYFRKLKAEPDHRASVLSEYGGYNCNIPGHTMSPEVYGYHTYTQEEYPGAVKKLIEEIRELRKQGLAGAIYTQLSDIEEETNGLFTYDRKVCKIKDIR